MRATSDPVGHFWTEARKRGRSPRGAVLNAAGKRTETGPGRFGGP